MMVFDDQFAKLFAVAKIEIKSKCGHAPLKVGKLGGLANGLAGAATPNQFSVSNPGTPLSEIVGTCGSIRSRYCVDTPSILTLPCSTYGKTATGDAQMSGICPPNRSLSAGAAPR
jgi:hypothetical protein